MTFDNDNDDKMYIYIQNDIFDFITDKNDEQALTYYQKSITKPALYKATQCERFMTYKLGLCNQNPTNWMGEYVDPKYDILIFFNYISSYNFNIAE